MTDEIIPAEFNSTEPPAVITEHNPDGGNLPDDPNQGVTPWPELSIDQKLDILHMKVDSMSQQVTWIGRTFQGVIDMVGKVSPMDIFKMMRGGK